MGLLARFFKGSLLWSELWLMTWKEMGFYFDIYELQITEEGVVAKYQKQISEGKRKEMPSYEKIREEVDVLIAERRQDINGENK